VAALWLDQNGALLDLNTIRIFMIKEYKQLMMHCGQLGRSTSRVGYGEFRYHPHNTNWLLRCLVHLYKSGQDLLEGWVRVYGDCTLQASKMPNPCLLIVRVSEADRTRVQERRRIATEFVASASVRKNSSVERIQFISGASVRTHDARRCSLVQYI